MKKTSTFPHPIPRSLLKMATATVYLFYCKIFYCATRPTPYNVHLSKLKKNI